MWFVEVVEELFVEWVAEMVLMRSVVWYVGVVLAVFNYYFLFKDVLLEVVV